MKVFDPEFSVPDFWTSRAKHRYLGITASFIATDFSVVDIMLDIKYVSAPHTAVVIADSLYESRIVSIVTDNGANMIASIQLLNQKPGCYAIKYLPCVSHTLQLAIRKGYTEALQLVQDVSTRWNSSYYAFDHLFFLCTSTNREEKKDGNKLRKIMLSDEEWDLVDELITLLIPFEQATCEFSGGSYVTLSKMVPTIKELIFNLGDFYEASLLGETITTTLLDPHYKNLDCIDDEHEKQQLIQQLYIEYNELKPELNINQNEHQLVDFINDISLTHSYQGYKHCCLLKGKRKNVLSNDHYLLDEVKSYLDLSLASENESPLQTLPYLSKLALKYLSIPASSVSIAKMLFLKRNMKFMNVFAPIWDSNEDIESE
ncbi:10689_t:CDS:2 [Entrophospora sp. SA101]|nr:10689_t:CDS:2 [Entrophospora sp. SA101]